MSDTPQTDEAEVWHEEVAHYHVVGSDLARHLERELNTAKQHIKRLEEESESRWNLAESAIASCDEMASRIKRLEEEVQVLRLYGNKDCTAQADAVLEAKEEKP